MTRAVPIAPVLLSACVMGGGDIDWTFEDATAARIALGNGSITVVQAVDDNVHLLWSGGGVGDAGIPGCDRDEDGMVTFDADGDLGGGDVIAEVPAGMEVQAFVDRGEVTVAIESPADVLACVAMGEVAMSVPAGAYDLLIDADAAEVSITGVSDDPNAAHRLGACVGAGSLAISGI